MISRDLAIGKRLAGDARVNLGIATIGLLVLWATTAGAATYTLGILGTLATDSTGNSYGRGINNSGLVVGRASADDVADRAFRWTASGGMTDIGALVSPYETGLLDVDSAGEAVGYGITQNGGFARSLRQAGGAAIEGLPQEPGSGDSYAYAVSDGGDAVGWTNLGSGCGSPECGNNPGYACHWKDGAVTLLPDLGGFWSVAANISPDGTMICGYGADPSGFIRAFRLHGGVVTPLPPLPGYEESYAQDVNDAGEVVGFSLSGSGAGYRATRWIGGAAFDLGVPPGADGSVAVAVNASGTIVGYSIVPVDAGYHAVLFPSGGSPQDLNSSIAPGSGWVLTYADAINDAGQIVGDATNGSATRAMVLTPSSVAAVEPPHLRPRGLELRVPEPNPARTGAVLTYALASGTATRLSVVDLAGREVIRLRDGFEAAGEHRVSWRGDDAAGHPVPSGVYFVRVQSGDDVRSQRLVVAR